MTTDRIACTLHTVPGGHTWQVAAASFADAFPWVVSRVDRASGTAVMIRRATHHAPRPQDAFGGVG